MYFGISYRHVAKHSLNSHVIKFFLGKKVYIVEYNKKRNEVCHYWGLGNNHMLIFLNPNTTFIGFSYERRKYA